MPVSEESDSSGAVYSLPPESETSNSAEPTLSELSPRDKPWDKHRGFADRVESYYAGSEFRRLGERIHSCSELLQFGLAVADSDSLKLKLRAARFCRVRPRYRWLFVTLTQKNVSIGALRETLVAMNRAFQRLSQRKAFPAIGWLRSTEVTRGRDGSAHPHFHCLLMVPSSYFSGRDYLKQADWVTMWRKALRLDYNPVLDVQAVKQGSKPMELIPELLKYCTKESDLVADKEWFLELTRQMHKMKCVTTGGVLKEYLKELEAEPEDLIGEGDEAESEDLGTLYFGWKRREKKYRLVGDQ